MQLAFSNTALKDLKKLGPSTKKQIIKKLAFFMDQANPLQHATNLKNFYSGDFRFRIGDYRLPFDVRGDTIYILHIEHRREVYRKK